MRAYTVGTALVFCVVFAVVVTLPLSRAVSAPAVGSGQKPEVRTADKVYKNIQVFKTLPAAELDQTMAFISGALGVKCNHCHVNPFEKDEKAQKQTARRMIQMVFELNKGSFGGENAVSCFTCHRGKPVPVSVPAVGQNLWAAGPGKGDTVALGGQLPADVQAVSGAAALQKSRAVPSKDRASAPMVLVPEEVYQKAPNKLLTVTSYPNVFAALTARA